MQKLVIALVSSTLILSACGKQDESMVKTPPAQPTQPNQATPTAASGEVQSGSTVSVDYTLTVDGTVIETSVEETAKNAGLYNSGATYQPLQFIVGSGNMIKGFDSGVLGMKVGEKKTITVSPEEGYGTGPVKNTVTKAQIAPTFSITQDMSKLEDTVTEQVTVEQLGEDGKDLSVGKKISGGNGVTAEVLAIDGVNVTLKIDNVINPFYQKPRTVGSVATQGTYVYTIASITGNSVVIDVVNNASPFSGKDFVVGAETTTPAGTLKIDSIEGDNVTIDFTHPLAGKTLTFDVDVKNIQ